ncbi:hypothetical protein ABD76_06775 [Paenibacillus dendritiformis]|uniref:hypothetical protein n=1 Tax=Paenibacillus dendritiformis TaxID=130049 RepID=UPI0018CF3091|nr:hypothetical protein [Paenibacillus dendritiformis]MBG9792220.1 hypothetical protein [Paenibacillus dendritiformis]
MDAAYSLLPAGDGPLVIEAAIGCVRAEREQKSCGIRDCVCEPVVPTTAVVLNSRAVPAAQCEGSLQPLYCRAAGEKQNAEGQSSRSERLRAIRSLKSRCGR